LDVSLPVRDDFSSVLTEEIASRSTPQETNIGITTARKPSTDIIGVEWVIDYSPVFDFTDIYRC
jgi:hypothetical protein